MTLQKFSKTQETKLFLTQQLRLVETGLWEIGTKLGVKTLEELDQKITSGKIHESQLGDDFYRFDFLLEKKSELEKALQKESIPSINLWESIRNSIGSPRWSLGI